MRVLPEGWVRTVLVLGAGALLLGSLVVVSGVISVKASAGHWPATRWFLSFTRERSVATHSADIDVPELDDLGRVTRGAAHFESACRVCHGAPGRDRSATMAELTPEPPRLETIVPERDGEDLFYVVKHGVKMTGMPAWPTQERDDEIWSMVAFLRVLPGMDSASYARLAGVTEVEAGTPESGEGVGAASAPPIVEARCARCHRRDGSGREGAFPRLAGQKPAYLEMTLEAYALGRRPGGIMRVAVSDASVGELMAAGRYYAALSTPIAETHRLGPASPGSVARGERIARSGIPDAKVPACIACHGPDPLAEGERNERYPLLAGQHFDYLVNQLELFREGRRGESLYMHVMELSADGLTPEDARAVAAYYSSIGAE